jgi:hypothetical protein
MKVKEILNKFFHVYTINVTMTTWWIFFGHILSCFHLELQLHFWEQNRFGTFFKEKPNKFTTRKESKVGYKNLTP